MSLRDAFTAIQKQTFHVIRRDDLNAMRWIGWCVG